MKGLPVQGCAVVMPSRMQLVPPSLAFTCGRSAQNLPDYGAARMRKGFLMRDMQENNADLQWIWLWQRFV